MKMQEILEHSAFKRINPEQYKSMTIFWVNEVDISVAAEDMCLPIEILRIWYASLDLQYWENMNEFPSYNK